MTDFCEWIKEKIIDGGNIYFEYTNCKNEKILYRADQYDFCNRCGKPVHEKPQRNPLALSEGIKDTTMPHRIYDLGYGPNRIEAIIRCRIVLDKYRPVDYVPDCTNDAQEKWFPYWTATNSSFTFCRTRITKYVENYWCLPTWKDWEQALTEMGEDDLKLALYGEDKS